MKTDNQHKMYDWLTPIFDSLEKQLRAEGQWPPPEGWSPSSPEWTSLFDEPFISFPLHPLPPNVQIFLDAMPCDDWGELDAISDLLEHLYTIPPGYIVVPMGGDQFHVMKQLKTDCD